MKNQTNLFDYFDTKAVRRRYGRTSHGGAKTTGHRKVERPLSTRKWIHLVLKSDKAKGSLSFLKPKNKMLIETILKEKAEKFGVRLGQVVNVGNHLHLKIKIPSREYFRKFLISITTRIARGLTGAARGRAFGKFWQGLAFTRVLTSSLEELGLKGYFTANEIEAQESYEKRVAYLRNFNAWVYRERYRTKGLWSSFLAA